MKQSRWFLKRDPGIAFAIHTTLAGLLALALATLLQIHHPYWAAMTVWLVAQPTRGLAIERGLVRLLGTVLGALAGFLMLRQFGNVPIALLSILIAWAAFCAGAGSLLRHFRSYGLVLAGYTAAVVTISALIEPGVGHDLAWSRIICTVIGVVASAIATLIFAPEDANDGVYSRSLDILRQACAVSAVLLRKGRHAAALPVSQFLASAIQFDADLDTLAAGSLTRHQRARLARHVARSATIMVTEAITLSEIFGKAEPNNRSAEALSAIDAELDNERFDRARAMTKPFQAVAPQLSVALSGAIGYLDDISRTSPPGRTSFDFSGLRQPDLKSACVAFFRTFVALGAVALTWQVSGWVQGPVMLMTCAVFITLFSSHEAPQLAVREALKGTICGATIGTVCRIFVLPHAGSSLDILLMVTPFLAIGAYAMSRKKTAKAAIDGNMSFLLSAQPVFPVVATPFLSVEQTVAMVAGVGAAALAFRFLFPVDRQLMLRSLFDRLTSDLKTTVTLARREDVLHRRLRMIQRVLWPGNLRLVALENTSTEVFLLLSLVTMFGCLLECQRLGELTAVEKRDLGFALSAIDAAPENWKHHHETFIALLRPHRDLRPESSV
ncbi:FUSC family protein [Agrobacterium rhizogenes]|uniref:FUSC family protein n=1 Tax=Rhizobium rhizogenes TaxID=359 RepID=UPI0013AF15EB|nr:FUSC family protein [Rhizobium rhizogenes]NTH79936.1 FUSC family protein [Rhizobium rhizogenes]NTH85913.1 FUSC family protein [Rhizobium rhizogenes]